MKKKIFLSLLVVVALFVVTGCGSSSKKENNNQTKSGNKSYTCVSIGQTTGGEDNITSLVVVLDKNNYIVEHRIINNITYPTQEMYENNKRIIEENIQKHKESKSASSYKWALKTDDKKRNTLSTRTYDMSGVRDSQGKTYDSIYNYFNEDGTYNIEGWMAYNREILHGGYNCSEDK